MNKITEKAQALQDEIASLLSFEASLNKKEEQLKAMEEDIKVQNMANIKIADDLSKYQLAVKKHDNDIIEREKQIIIKEKTIRMTQQVLEDQKSALRGKETEIIDRENKLIQKEKEFADWEGKIKLADNEVREQKILNQKEQSLDQIRKDKLRIKEGQIENELTRLKGINL